jgi:hypothetical protein
MDPETERYYRVLNLEPTASPEDVYAAYRDLVRIWDPQRFVTQPRLELMAEAKLKEIIEAYNALTSKPEVSATPAPPEAPQLLSPVPDHVVDRNVPNPVFAPGTPVAPDPGQRPEEPPVPRPLSAWEQERPPSYPQAAPPPVAPTIQFAPPPPPPQSDVWRLAAQFSAFLIPVVLVGLGLYLYDSGSSRSERQDKSLSQESAGAAKNRAAHPGDGVPAHHAPKKAARSAEEEAAEAAPISLPNGAQLMPPLGPRGAGRFRIANRSGQDAVIRVALQSVPGTPVRLVYVQAGTEVPIEGFGTGVYMVSISLGPLTRAPRKFAPPLGPFQFMQIESVDGPQSDDYQLVLKPSP